MVKLSQALRLDEIEELKSLQSFSGKMYGGTVATTLFTKEPILDPNSGEPVVIPMDAYPALNPEVLDGDSLVKIIGHIDEEIPELIQSYAAATYRPGGEQSSFNGAPISFTEDPPPSREDLDPMWRQFVTYQKYLIQRLSSFRIRIMEAECWFDEQGYLENLNMSEPMRKSIEGNPEAQASHEEFMERYRELQESNSWLPEREQDEAIMQTEEDQL